MEEILKEFETKLNKFERAFILNQFRSYLEERDEKWKTAILYNVDSADLERIEGAFKALI